MNTPSFKVVSKPIIIVVDGIISTGKSTYIKAVKEDFEKRGYRVTVIPEPVEEWVQSGILQIFYADATRWGYTFQTKAFRDRVKTIRDYYNTYRHSTDVFFVERWPTTDRVFMKTQYDLGSVTELEMKLYTEWCDEWELLVPCKPDFYVYLRTPLDVCMKRLAERDRDGESKISAQYQQKLQDNHDELFTQDSKILNGAPFLLIDYEVDFKTCAAGKAYVSNNLHTFAIN